MSKGGGRTKVSRHHRRDVDNFENLSGYGE